MIHTQVKKLVRIKSQNKKGIYIGFVLLIIYVRDLLSDICLEYVTVAVIKHEFDAIFSKSFFFCLYTP